MIGNWNYGTGRRKSSVARVFIQKGDGQIVVNGKSTSADLANMICAHVYDLALMAQKSFDADSMKGFLQRSNQLLTRLTSNI